MNKTNLLYFLVSFLFLFNTQNEIKAQTNTCSGGPTLFTEAQITNFGAGSPGNFGDGTTGYVQVCITAANVGTSMCSGIAEHLRIRTTSGTYLGQVNAGTILPVCFTSTINDGLINITDYCASGTNTYTITWTTLNTPGGTSVCPTCSDGIQNQGETGVDCGGPCAPCVPTCSDGILNQGETGVDCGGPCAPCGAPSCTDGILNQDETGIDCGGATCPVCPTCFDGILNGDETGIDCGGSCALLCTINGLEPDGDSGNCCDDVVDATVYPTNCDQIGTSAYNLNSPQIEITSGPSACVPAGAPSGCAAYTSEGTWMQFDLAPGVTYLQLSTNLADVISFGTGNSQTNYAFFQGSDCSSLNYVDCSPAIQFSSSQYYFFEASVSGLDPNQDVWVYVYNNNGKAFNYVVQAVGAAPATNQSCPGSPALGEACNLGSTGASFPTPGACNGGNWGSNENTTFYSFTADSTAGSLLIDDIICNDGTNGSAQFAVWNSCLNIGTYTNPLLPAPPVYLGCAVGTGTISLNNLTIGQTYYIAADGFAGDNCKWAFTGTGIILPVELGGFTAHHNGKEVELDWTTITERNNDYFTVQRTLNGEIFENIGTVKGAGTTQERQNYSFIDYHPYDGTSYYRIKQTDYDGAFVYTDIVSVKNGKTGILLIKTVNLMGQEVGDDYRGMVIDVFSDGSTVKRVKF